MREMEWERDEGMATLDGKVFFISNKVRNEIDPIYKRRLHDYTEVRRAVVNGEWGPPYMPRKFPIGEWMITDVVATTVPDFFPFKIKTNAHQKVQIWELDDNGGYDHPIDEYVDDSAYYLHWNKLSEFTLGCGRIDTENNARALAALIRDIWRQKESIALRVF